jgi:hypothetical protein
MMKRALYLLLFLLPFLSYGQLPRTPYPYLESYFSQSPLQRLHSADSIIHNHGSVGPLSWYEVDLQALLDDTARLHDCYNVSGHIHNVSSYDQRKLKCLTSKWKKLIRKKRFSKLRSALGEIDYAYCFTAADSFGVFFEPYIQLSVVSRIEYFETHCDSMNVDRAKIICMDLNAISGKWEWPFTKENGQERVNLNLAQASVRVWKHYFSIE